MRAIYKIIFPLLILITIAGYVAGCIELNHFQLLNWTLLLYGLVVSLAVALIIQAPVEIFILLRKLGIKKLWGYSEKVKKINIATLKKATYGTIFRTIGTIGIMIAIAFTGFTPFIAGASFYVGLSVFSMLIITTSISSIVKYNEEIRFLKKKEALKMKTLR